jgi:hypothetical protein
MAAENQVAGRAEILGAYVTNREGKQINIERYLMNMSIFEDVYTPFVYCEMVLVDYEEFARKVPLVGEEFLVFSYKSMQGKTVTYQFFLYKQDTSAINPINAAAGYVLRGVTLEKAFDQGKTVFSSYKGTYDGIAGQIFDDYVRVDTNGLEFQSEPSKSIQRFVVPQLTPLEAIDWCRHRAVSSQSEAKTPYVFFRNSNGFYFISLNGLFNRSSQEESAKLNHVYFGKPIPPDQGDLYDDKGQPYKADIVSFDVMTNYDTMDKMRSGAYNSSSFSFDLTTKAFVLRKQFNLSENYSKFQLGNEGEFNTAKFMEPLNNTRCVVFFEPVDFSVELEGTSTNFHPDAIGEMNAYGQVVSEFNAHFRMYGDSNITAGQVLRVSIPPPTGDKTYTRSIDKGLSGSLLCMRVRHDFFFEENVTYYLSISGVNGTNIGAIKDLPNE